MKRGVLITLGVLLLLLGVALVAAGAAVAMLLGPSGAVVSAPAQVSGSGVAIVADDVAADAGSLPVPAGFGELTFSVRSITGSTVFVGTAPAAPVDTYLAGAPYDVVVDLGAGRQATTRKVPGTQQPQPPATQAFWTTRAVGAPATFGSVPAGTSLVIMNADARPGIAAEVTARLSVRNAWTAAWIAVGVGALALVLAVICFWRARVARRRTRATQSSVAVTPLSPSVLPDAGSHPAQDGPAPPEAAPLEPDPVTDLATTAAVGTGGVSMMDDTMVMAPVAPPAVGDETGELPTTPPVAGDLVDVTPDPDEPPAQGGSATLAALVAAASPGGVDIREPESETASEPQPATEPPSPSQTAPESEPAPEPEPAAEPEPAPEPEPGPESEPPTDHRARIGTGGVVHGDLAHDPDPATDPVFTEIAERWGLLPAEARPDQDRPLDGDPHRSGVDGSDAG